MNHSHHGLCTSSCRTWQTVHVTEVHLETEGRKMQCGLWRWIKELTVHEYDDVQPVQSAGTVVLLEALRASEANKGAGTVADGLLILI